MSIDSLDNHPEVGTARNLTDRLVLTEAKARFDVAERNGVEALGAWAKRRGRPALLSLEALSDGLEDAEDLLDQHHA